LFDKYLFVPLLACNFCRLLNFGNHPMKARYTFPVFILMAVLLPSLIILNACKKEEGDKPDIEMPLVRITHPADSAMIQAGTVVSVEVSLTGFGSGARVAYSVDSIDLIESSTPPYGISWTTAGWDPGTYTLRADAWEGNILVSDQHTVILIDTIPVPQAPVAVISIFPDKGSTDTVFTFDASGSFDPDGQPDELLFRWDFDGDGSWDTDAGTQSVYHYKYHYAKSYNVRLQVIDADGLTSDTIQKLPVSHSSVPNACGGLVSIPYGGKVYRTVAIGSQCWFRENLDIGEMVAGGDEQSNNGIIEKYCYNDDPANCDKYGGLYKWREAMKHFPVQGGQGICPNGWHIPTDAEWKELEGFVDSQYGVGDPVWDDKGFRGHDAGMQLKAFLYWASGGNGENSFDFRAVPGGFFEEGFTFSGAGQLARFWSSGHDTGLNGMARTLSYDSEQVSRTFHWEEAAFTVRCLKN